MNPTSVRSFCFHFSCPKFETPWLADTNFEVVRGVAEDNFKVRGGQHLWCFFGVGVETAKLLNFSAGRPYFVSISTYWTTSKLVPDNIRRGVALALSSGTVALAEYVLAEKIKTN